MQPALPSRDRDLSELLSSAETPASAILVVGVPGSGRSTLLERLRESTTVPNVWVAPHPWEKYRPLAGLSLALNATGDHRLTEFMDGISVTELTVDETIAIAIDLLALLRDGTRDDLLLLIDDADQFDQNTQLALTYVAGRLADTNLRMVLAVRPESTYSGFAGIRSVWMSRLDRHECMELARGLVPDADEQTLSMVCEGSSGLPGMVTTALAQLTRDQLRGRAPLALPLYHDAESISFSAWAPETVLLLQRLSTAPLCSLTAIPGARDINRSVLEKLTTQGVLEINGPFVSIRDGALRSSLYWSMTNAQREELHAVAAIEEEGHSLALVLWHADHARDPLPQRARLLVQAEELYQQGLVEAGTEFVERALLLNPTPDDMLKPLLSIANRLSFLSEFGLARRYIDVCRRAASKPRQLAECLRLEVTIASLADESIDTGQIDVYARRYRKESPHTSAELLSFAAVYLAVIGNIDESRSLIDRADRIESAEKVERGSLQDWARRYVDGIDGKGSTPRATNGDELDIEKMPEAVQLVAGRALMVEENYPEARHVFRSLALGSPVRARGKAWKARILALSAETEIRAGNVPEASRLIDSLAELAPAQNLATLLLFAWNEAVVRDRVSETLLSEARARGSSTHQPILVSELLAVEGHLALMHGEFDHARNLLARGYETALDLRPDFIRVEADFVEVLALRGEWDVARRVTDRFAERVREHPSAWSECALARCEAIVAPDSESIARFSSALQLAKKHAQPFELARTRLSFAVALDSVGQRQRASEQRQRAEYEFERLLAAGWVRAVRGSTRTIDTPAPNSLLSTLTENELAVLRLMHQGVRNKDIAAALFVSLRTVEVRITQIYRKLEARSRSHLLTLVPELDAGDSN